MKNVMRIVLLLHFLQKRIELTSTVIKLRPVVVLQHVGIGIVHVAALIMFVGEGRAEVGLVGCGCGVRRGVGITNALQAGCVILRILPICLILQFHDRGALDYGCIFCAIGVIDGASIG